MPRSAHTVSDNISEHMRREALDVLTMRWPAFYAFCDRDRMTDNFMDTLDKALNLDRIVLARGSAVIAFLRDEDFSPMEEA